MIQNEPVTKEQPKQVSRFKWLKWAIVIVVIITVVVGLLLLFGGQRQIGPFSSNDSSNSDSNSLPQFIQADFIDLDKITYISKFRSGSGHDFSGNGEKCRSMKHYFNTQDTREKMDAFSQNNGIPPAPDGNGDISIYSPVDGKIISVKKEQMPIGVQIYIRPKLNSEFTIRLFHIYLNDDIKKGSAVKAGQKIGVISKNQNTDIAISKGSPFGQNFISYFDVMPDSIFKGYQDRGVKSRSDFIISKKERDAKPLACNGEQFAKNRDQEASSDDFVFLSGYQGQDSFEIEQQPSNTNENNQGLDR